MPVGMLADVVPVGKPLSPYQLRLDS